MPSVSTDSQWSKQEAFYCMCGLGVAPCQSQHQCHFWQMNFMFEAYCTGKLAWLKCQSNLCYSLDSERLQKSNDSFKACIENVNIYK